MGAIDGSIFISALLAPVSEGQLESFKMFRKMQKVEQNDHRTQKLFKGLL